MNTLDHEAVALAIQQLDRLKFEEGDKSPAVLIFGGTGSGNFLWALDHPLPQEAQTPDTYWDNRGIAQITPLLEGATQALAAVAKERWPNVRVYDCHCTCCNVGLTEVS